MWLEDLRDMGVDLRIYGNIEQELLKQELLNQEFTQRCRHNSYYHRYCDILSLRLINFTYGESPDDWHIWVSDIWDEAVGDFWRMVDCSSKQMPGAWNEEDEENDCKGNAWKYYYP
jgi:hypothetical protein